MKLPIGYAAHRVCAFGKFGHNREPTRIDKQTVIRPNRNTPYSAAVFDREASANEIFLRHIPAPSPLLKVTVHPHLSFPAGAVKRWL